jgi:hypothetical protein
MAMMAKVLIPAHGRSRRSSRNRLRDLAVFDLAIDSKLRGCNVVALKVVNVAPNGYAGRSSIHSPAQNRKASSLRDRWSKRAKQSTNISSNGPAGAVHTCFQEAVGQVI